MLRLSALVQLHPPISLPGRPQFLLLDPPLLRRGGRLGLTPLLGNVKRVSHQRRESLLGGGAVLLLAAAIARYDAHHSVAIEPSRELRAQSLALLVCHGV